MFELFKEEGLQYLSRGCRPCHFPTLLDQFHQPHSLTLHCFVLLTAVVQITKSYEYKGKGAERGFRHIFVIDKFRGALFSYSSNLIQNIVKNKIRHLLLFSECWSTYYFTVTYASLVATYIIIPNSKNYVTYLYSRYKYVTYIEISYKKILLSFSSISQNRLV